MKAEQFLRCACGHARGISLIEVLVSLVILSLGVLSVVALQLVSKRNNTDAGQRTVAAQVVYDIIARMRANSTQTTLAAYLTGVEPVGRNTRGDTKPSPVCETGSPCTAAELIAHDLWVWEQALDGAAETVAAGKTGGLVLPTGCIAQTTDDGGGDGIYTITIAWRGAVPIPDSRTGTAQCGRVGQPGNSSGLYGAQDEFRRSISIPAYITARR